MNALLLDVGNSRLKWIGAQDGALLAGGAIEHGGEPAAAVAAIPAAAPAAIWIANVTGAEAGERLGHALQQRFGVAPRFAAVADGSGGLRVAYAQTSRLGVDRWLAMLAAWSESRGAVCVASAGTALTFDAVDAQGQHLGGVIAPGLYAMQAAVLDTTRFAAAAPDEQYAPGLGTDTEACVRQGALHAAAGLLQRLQGRYGDAAACLLTGGDAHRLLPHVGTPWRLRPNLVLEGLLALSLDR